MSAFHDLKASLRQLSRRPSYSLVSIAILSLSIGMTAAVFCLVYAILLKPLPYPDADRLLVVFEEDASSGQRQGPSPPNFRDWSRESRLFESLAAVSPGSFVLRKDGVPVRVPALSVSSGFGKTLGIQLAAGRFLSEEDSLSAGEPVALISHRFWQTHLGGVADPLGQQLQTTNYSLTVVGVLPPDFYYPDLFDRSRRLETGRTGQPDSGRRQLAR